MKLFARKPKITQETAPQLTQWDRAAFALPGARLGQLGYETYDEMLKDSMVQTAVTLKKLAIMAAEFEIEPADSSAEAQAKAKFVAQAFERLEGSALEIVGHATDAFAKGWSVQELVFEQDKGALLAHGGATQGSFSLRRQGRSVRSPGRSDPARAGPD